MPKTDESSFTPAAPPSIRLPFLGSRQLLILGVVLTAALIPAFWFIRNAAEAVSKYGAAAFEEYARAALASKDYDEAIEISTGAIRSSLSRQEHWGLAYLLMAEGHAGKADFTPAVESLEETARQWSHYYYLTKPPLRQEAQQLGKTMGDSLLEKGDSATALRAYSAAGIAGGDPVAFLKNLNAELSAELKAKLWDGRPYLILEDFSTAAGMPRTAAESQKSMVRSSSIQDNSITGGKMAVIEVVGDAQATCVLTVPLYVPLTDPTGFGLRAYLGSEQPVEGQCFAGLWVERAQQALLLNAAVKGDLDQHWREYQLDRAIQEEGVTRVKELGYAAPDAFISQAGMQFVPGAENKLYFDRIDLYLP